MFKNNAIWSNFTKALGLEVREHKIIRGVSGLDHQVLSLGIDEKNKRLLLVSGDADPRVTAMMQADIQPTLPDMKILVARPVIVDLGVIAQRFFHRCGYSTITVQDIKDLVEDVKNIESKSLQTMKSTIAADVLARLGKWKALDDTSQKGAIVSYIKDVLAPVSKGYHHSSLSTISQIITTVQQAAYLDWKQISLQTIEDNFDEKTNTLSLNAFPQLESMRVDREHGVCPLPLYEFTENDWEVFSSGKNFDDIQIRLKELGIHQYFFPSPDQLALGLIDRGVDEATKVEKAISIAPDMGHPLGHTELLGTDVKIPDLIDNLGDKGYLVEGEIGIEITPEGRTARANVKFRPREGFVTKLINRISISLGIQPNL